MDNEQPRIYSVRVMVSMVLETFVDVSATSMEQAELQALTLSERDLFGRSFHVNGGSCVPLTDNDIELAFGGVVHVEAQGIE